MKLASLLATAAILLAPGLHAQEIIEANLSYSLKLHIKQPQAIKGTQTVSSFKIFAIKTADIIRMIGQKEGTTFSKKALLIYQQVRFDNETSEVNFFIRDAGIDHLVTSYIDTFPPLFSDQSSLAIKGNVNTNTGLGTGSQLSINKHNIALEGSLSIPTQGFELMGPSTITYKVISSKKLTVPVGLIVPTGTFTLSGRGIEVLDGDSGYVSGTVKLTGPKVLK